VSDDSVSIKVHFDAEREREASAVPEDDSNLAVRAALLLRKRTGITDGAALSIRKVIPVAGGMAGGSADAAAALVACNELWGTGLTRTELELIGAEIGSDVPFLIHGGIAKGGGRGELINPVLARGSYHWVFAIAAVGLSTKEVYAEFDRLNVDRDVPDPEVSDDLLKALRAGDAARLGDALSNDLTEAAFSLRPELANTIDVGLECDALGAIVSGSGPTTMFLARDDSHALDIAFALTSAQVCADTAQATGPVHGARLT
jgi:4-diphosphocytidyl-2-C-methyl-D-erythritol kinase